MKMLVEAEERARRLGGELWVAALDPAVKRMVRRSPLGTTLGPERMFMTSSTRWSISSRDAFTRSRPR